MFYAHLNCIFLLLCFTPFPAFTLHRPSNDPHSFVAIVNPDAGFVRDTLIVGVNSKFDNVMSRNLHRRSWMQHEFVRDGIVQVRFLLAGNASLYEDDTEAGDCIQLPVPEGYHHLTAKTLAYLEWCKNNSNAHYVMKLDDDSYPHLDALLPFMQNKPSRLSYMGMLMYGPVLRTGKYAESTLQGDQYPPYMHGAAYVLSRRLVDEITRPEFSIATFDNENTTIGIRVDALHSGLMPRQRTVEYIQIPYSARRCHADDAISINWDARQFPCVYAAEKHVQDQGEAESCPCAAREE